MYVVLPQTELLRSSPPPPLSRALRLPSPRRGLESTRAREHPRQQQRAPPFTGDTPSCLAPVFFLHNSAAGRDNHHHAPPSTDQLVVAAVVVVVVGSALLSSSPRRRRQTAAAIVVVASPPSSLLTPHVDDTSSSSPIRCWHTALQLQPHKATK